MNNITITGQLGPGVTTTSKVFDDVAQLNFRSDDEVLDIHYRDSGNTTIKIASYQLSNIATVTYTIASGSATVVAST